MSLITCLTVVGVSFAVEQIVGWARSPCSQCAGGNRLGGVPFDFNRLPAFIRSFVVFETPILLGRWNVDKAGECGIRSTSYQYQLIFFVFLDRSTTSAWQVRWQVTVDSWVTDEGVSSTFSQRKWTYCNDLRRNTKFPVIMFFCRLMRYHFIGRSFENWALFRSHALHRTPPNHNGVHVGISENRFS